MYIVNLNDPEQPTIESTQKMLASVDDSEHSQIRVSRDGGAYIQHVSWGEDHPEGILFRCEVTFAQGTGYVGPEAAKDAEWVREVYEDLKNLQKAYEDLKTNWPKPTGHLLYEAEEPYSLKPPMVEGYLGPYANWTLLAKGYGGKKHYIEYPRDEDGATNLMNRRVHVF